jgi:hypothetical protein
MGSDDSLRESLLTLVRAVGGSQQTGHAKEIAVQCKDATLHVKSTQYVPIHVTVGTEVKGFDSEHIAEAVDLFLSRWRD